MSYWVYSECYVISSAAVLVLNTIVLPELQVKYFRKRDGEYLRLSTSTFEISPLFNSGESQMINLQIMEEQ